MILLYDTCQAMTQKKLMSGAALSKWVAILALAGVGLASVPQPNAQEPILLSLHDMTQMVLDHNESVQVRILEAEIGRRTLASEKGIFEPQITGSVERVDSVRPNNAQQIASLGFSAQPFLTERNTLYNSGVEFLTPLGTKLRTGLTIRQLGNNIQQNGTEVETFLGATITQPLLKNFGTDASMARIRLAAVASDIAFQEYRKQLMIVLSQAESAYWDLYLMQEQEEISAQSIDVAARILKDAEARKEVGKGAQVDVLQAGAAVSQRRAKFAESRHRVIESVSRLTSYYLDPVVVTNALIRAVDHPEMRAISLDQYENAQDAFNDNPDYLIRQQRLKQDDVRLKYAKNQRLPQVDAKAAYGFNGLGHSLGGSFDMIDDFRAPVWSVGVELSIPMMGGIKEKNELAAAKVGRTRSMVAVQEAAVQITSALAAALSKVRTYEENMLNHQEVADDLQGLLDAQIEKYEAGSLESRWVFETLDKWSDARAIVIEDRVQYRRALLELELIRGATLRSRGLEVTKADLANKINGVLADARWSAKELKDFQQRTEAEIEKQLRPQ
jgi:outer membrane protein TolC